jgi:hypothetical protein
MLELVLAGLVASGRKIEGKIEAIAVIFACVFEPALKIEAFITAIAGVFASIFMDKSREEQVLGAAGPVLGRCDPLSTPK